MTARKIYIAIHAFDREGSKIGAVRSQRIHKEDFDARMVSQGRMRQIASENLASSKPIERVFGIVVNKK